MATDRVSVEDLAFAATWLRALEGLAGVPVAGQDPEDDDEQQARCRRVAAWLDAEVARRERDSSARSLAAEIERRTGRRPSLARVRQGLRDHA